MLLKAGPEQDGSRCDSPSFRLLQAVEIIGLFGPLTSDSLKRRLGISKTATWRLLTTLRAAGWVQFRRGGQMVELSARLDEVFARSHFSDTELATLRDGLHQLGQEHPAHFDLYTLHPTGRPELIDTTRRLTVAAQYDDDDDGKLLLALRAAMTPQQLARHLGRLAEGAEPAMAEAIRSGEEARRVRQVRGVLRDERSVYICLRGRMGSPAVMRVECRGRVSVDTVLSRAHRVIVERFASVVEFWPGPGDNDGDRA